MNFNKKDLFITSQAVRSYVVLLFNSLKLEILALDQHKKVKEKSAEKKKYISVSSVIVES